MRLILVTALLQKFGLITALPLKFGSPIHIPLLIFVSLHITNPFFSFDFSSLIRTARAIKSRSFTKVQFDYCTSVKIRLAYTHSPIEYTHAAYFGYRAFTKVRFRCGTSVKIRFTYTHSPIDFRFATQHAPRNLSFP